MNPKFFIFQTEMKISFNQSCKLWDPGFIKTRRGFLL